jgi:multicomponent Na+:H+ antiporter subunit D
MVCGIGIGTELTLNGAAAHAFTHIIYKGLLFMSAGSVLYMTGKRKCSELGGLFQSMPLTTVCGTIGALAISSFPFTSGFISKSLINSGAGEEHLTLVYFLLTAASAGVFLHAGIKFPWFVFFQKDSGLRPPDPPWNRQAGMVLLAVGCIGLGLFPGLLYAGLPFPVEYVPYTGAHLVTQLQLLLFAGLAFFVMLPVMKRTETLTLDWDWLYRRLGSNVVAQFATRGKEGWEEFTREPAARVRRVLGGLFRTHGPHGSLARSWPSGSMVLWVGVILGAYLIIALL